jgi:hypothetical protein
MALFLGAWMVGLCQFLFLGGYGFGRGFEMAAIARSLAEQGAYANPFAPVHRANRVGTADSSLIPGRCDPDFSHSRRNEDRGRETRARRRDSALEDGMSIRYRGRTSPCA